MAVDEGGGERAQVGITVLPEARIASSVPRTSSAPRPWPSWPATISVWATITLSPAGR
jgi:hypothetical protein